MTVNADGTIKTPATNPTPAPPAPAPTAPPVPAPRTSGSDIVVEQSRRIAELEHSLTDLNTKYTTQSTKLAAFEKAEEQRAEGKRRDQALGKALGSVPATKQASARAIIKGFAVGDDAIDLTAKDVDKTAESCIERLKKEFPELLAAPTDDSKTNPKTNEPKTTIARIPRAQEGGQAPKMEELVTPAGKRWL